MQKNNQNPSGFTLIEVLVVVLIIGILSSIALPQYQKAVMKSRFAKVRQAAMSYKDMADVYYSTYNAWPTSFDTLDAGPLAGGELTSDYRKQCSTTGDMFCCLIRQIDGAQAAGVVCGTNDYSIGFEYMFISETPYCISQNANGAATKVCASFGTRSNGWQFITPTGNQSGYMYYKL